MAFSVSCFFSLCIAEIVCDCSRVAQPHVLRRQHADFSSETTMYADGAGAGPAASGEKNAIFCSAW